MLELTNQRAKLVSVNVRAEIHGEDRKPACDLKISFKASNDILAFFHPSLKGAFYALKDGASPDGQPSQADMIGGKPVEGGPPADGYTVKRFACMGPIAWDWKGVGYTVEIPYGVSGKADIALNADIDNFRFELQEGGTVETTMRAQCHPTEEQIGRLCSMIQTEIEVSLTPPESADEEPEPRADTKPVTNKVAAGEPWPFSGEKPASNDEQAHSGGKRKRSADARAAAEAAFE